ncbi:lipid A export ATP-binding/permease protein MsbA [Roseibium sp. TrichSKD4]|uniref:ABC transporter ATP-binding protein n=1 Tax=Roseibium sp. TrichSKD4 TaxID=744980 RepID=UPI0001E571F5|nr:ABC transporter ATP-binding protein [Roseibium sp. TrichSKD4]EFO29664.1 lipid A export ATP-binding/permease protein MsbA [Roseibium sp. TrichSKD4]
MLNTEKWQVFQDPDGTYQLIKRLLRENLRQYASKYALAFLFMGLVAASTAASAWIMRDVINEIFISRDPKMVYLIAGVVMLIFAIKGGATYGQLVILSRIGNAIVAGLQRRLFAKLARQDMAYFDKTAMGDVVVRINQGATDTRTALDMVVVTLGRDVLTLVGLVIVMLAQDPTLSLFALFIMPPAVIGVTFLVKRVRKHAKQQFVSTAQIMSIIQETTIGIRVVKAFGVETALEDRMETAVRDVEKQANKIAALTARTSPLMETLGGFAIALVILYGGYSVVNLGQDPGAFFAFITALLLAYDPAKRLARLQVNLNKSLVGVRLMYELLDDNTGMDTAEGGRALAVSAGKVDLRDIAFSYGEGAALKKLTLTAEPGKMTALVGSSGAGKSTAFSLIERFYEPGSGQVLIDDQDVARVPLDSLREQIAYVGQDTFLFDISIRDNITIGRPDASQAEIEEAARNANAHDFILELENGYDTFAGEGGGRLSGGQRQRIAIARAMLRDAPILLLDEATSALDAESESKIQAALTRLMEGRTTLVIAHRLSTVRHADCIHVLDKGEVVESGTHAELFAKDGIYRRLAELQFQDGKSDNAA